MFRMKISKIKSLEIKVVLFTLVTWSIGIVGGIYLAVKDFLILSWILFLGIIAVDLFYVFYETKRLNRNLRRCPLNKSIPNSLENE